MRYQLEKGSTSAHCCFEWTVLDTETPVLHLSEGHRLRWETVCECFDESYARQVCDALNPQTQDQSEGGVDVHDA